MDVNCADYVYKAMGELIQILYHYKQEVAEKKPRSTCELISWLKCTWSAHIFAALCLTMTKPFVQHKRVIWVCLEKTDFES